MRHLIETWATTSGRSEGYKFEGDKLTEEEVQKLEQDLADTQAKMAKVHQQIEEDVECTKILNEKLVAVQMALVAASPDTTRFRALPAEKESKLELRGLHAERAAAYEKLHGYLSGLFQNQLEELESANQ